jgi:hypothetical protein
MTPRLKAKGVSVPLNVVSPDDLSQKTWSPLP